MDRTTVVVLGVGLVVLYLGVRNGNVGRRELLLLAAVVPSIILHEVSHGAAALAFGDDTAKRAGRLTLNPVRHVDPFGTVILPALLALSGFAAFGYAKPVPVNPARMRRPRDHGLLTSLAGPATNVAIALAVAVVLRLGTSGAGFGPGAPSLALQYLFALGLVNVVLAVFNLIPVPPLDGSAVIERLLPQRYWPTYLRVRQYSMIALLALVLLRPRFLSQIFDPAVDLWARLLV